MLDKIKDWKVGHFFILFFAFLWGTYFYNEAWKAWNDHPVISRVLGGLAFAFCSFIWAICAKWVVKIWIKVLKE